MSTTHVRGYFDIAWISLGVFLLCKQGLIRGQKGLHFTAQDTLWDCGTVPAVPLIPVCPCPPGATRLVEEAQ